VAAAVSGPLSNVSASVVASYFGFEGLNQRFDIGSCGNCQPPDVEVAAGPNYVVQIVNKEGAIFSKQGTLVQTLNLTRFFKASVQADPRVIYDSLSGRFFASIVTSGNNFNCGSNVSIAVSASSDPTGNWNVYTLSPCSSIFPDHPTIGMSNDKVVVTAFAFQGGSSAGAIYWVVNKSEMVGGFSTLDFVFFPPNNLCCNIYPVQSLSSTTTQYMVSTGVGSTVNLFSITGVPPNPLTVNLAQLQIFPMTVPPDAVQRGTSTTVNVHQSGVQVMSAVWFQGKLWYSADDACTPSGDSVQRSCVRLTQIDTTSAKVIQDLDFAANGKYYFYPALSIDVYNNLDVIFGYSSSSDYPSLGITGQASGDHPGTLASPVAIKSGTGPNTSGSYGDYFGAGLDPSDPALVWVAGEYGNSLSSVQWFTFIASMRLPDFTTTASPRFLTITPGSQGTSTITLASLGNLATTIALSATVSPSGTKSPTATLSPNSLTLASGGTGSTTLTISTKSNEVGTYSISVVGLSGSLSHSVTLNATLGSFSISVPSTVTLQQGSAVSFQSSLTSLDGFSGTVTLLSSNAPIGMNVYLIPSSLSLQSNGSAPFTLTLSPACGVPVGTYTIMVTGKTGTISRSASISVNVTFNSACFG
jgi:hypothetical protein